MILEDGIVYIYMYMYIYIHNLVILYYFVWKTRGNPEDDLINNLFFFLKSAKDLEP